MKRFGLFGLVLVVSIVGACNDNGGGSGFALPRGQVGEVRITIGSPSTCVGGSNDGGDCSPFSDCQDAFCSQICILAPPGPNDFGTPCTSDAECINICAFACDRGIEKEELCSQDTNCPDGTCTTAMIHDVDYIFNPISDEFATVLSTDTDGDGDGFTPAVALEAAALGTQGEICVDFLDDVEDCINITWGPQQIQVFQACGDPIGGMIDEAGDCATPATFSFPE